MRLNVLDGTAGTAASGGGALKPSRVLDCCATAPDFATVGGHSTGNIAFVVAISVVCKVFCVVVVRCSKGFEALALAYVEQRQNNGKLSSKHPAFPLDISESNNGLRLSVVQSHQRIRFAQ